MRLALHSVSYSSTGGGQVRLTLGDFVAKAKELGYDGPELTAKRPHASPLDLPKRARRQLRRAVESAGMSVCALASYHDWAGGWLSYEMCSPLVGGGHEANLDRNARKTPEYMRAIFRELGVPGSQ